MFEAAFRRLNRDRIFELTGIQFLEFNTLYQLLAMRLQGSAALGAARTLLIDPRPVQFLVVGAEELGMDGRRHQPDARPAQP